MQYGEKIKIKIRFGALKTILLTLEAGKAEKQTQNIPNRTKQYLGSKGVKGEQGQQAEKAVRAICLYTL